ncbi:ligand-binding sensor domain-containing protein [Pedobacter agri]|uniref:Histidine kinase n=1 Tax=Pedobacter agri TaxID=454586 RepID=A0A9X3DJH1_9SPHI|nr:two-component regulator propeller domain-containing protein [Pedobacter agri]MCX3267321.1 histidine kinase [Pedobacter agri]
MKTWIVSLIILAFGGYTARAQLFPNLKFNQITVRDGLSTNAVRCTYEDQNGIIWIATAKGLNRYDGTGIKEFKHSDTDSTSICNDVIINIAADKEHQLWLGTAKGLSRFNPQTGKAVNYFQQPENKNSLAHNYNCAPFVDSKGNLWIATSNGIQLFDYRKNTFVTFPPAPGTAEDHNAFNLIKEDKNHRLWALGYKGLYLIDQRNKKIHPYSQQDNILSLYQASDGNSYIGKAEGGLNAFYSKENILKPINIPFLKRPSRRVNDIAEWTDNNQNKWLCVAASGGFILKNLRNDEIKGYISDELNPAALNAFNIYHIAKDRQNRLWLSTDNGISIVDPNFQNFENIPLYQQIKLNNPKLLGIPNNMLETEDRFYITCYYAKGIYTFSKNWQLLSHIAQIPETAKSFLSKSINSIYRDDKKNFWFSTDSGLVKKSGNRYKIFFPPVDTSNKDNLVISKLYKRKDGKFWIRARQNGIYLFNPSTEKFIKQYPPDGKDIDGSVYSGLIDKQDDFWIGATKSISVFNPARNAFDKITIKDIDGKIRDVTWVTDITQDKENVIWAVSDIGLMKIDKKRKTGLLIDHKMKLPENYLKRILIDSTGNLWIPSQQGIIKYDRKKTFTYFNFNNGLPFQYEGHGFFEIDKTGHFLLSYSGYVTRFNPYNIKSNTAVPRVIFMDLSADGQEKTIHITGQTKAIVLKPGTKIVNIHFALTSYTAPQENKYFYKIGKDAAWQQVKNGDIALGSMPNGKYVLYIKGCNNDEVFSAEEQLLITVLPHWYEKNWFRILCVLLIVVTIFLLVRRRIIFIRNQFLIKQRLSESELKSIRSQMNPHFIFNVLNSIEAYIMENDKKTASRLIQKFAALSRLILENSTKSLVTADKEWKALMLYTELEAMRYAGVFTYDFEVDDDIQLKSIHLPPMLIQPLIENAILHGLIAHEQTDGQLKVTLIKTDNGICISVQDNGIGYGTETKTNRFSGIKEKSMGLASIKERIEMINKQNPNSVRASFSITSGKNQSGTIAEVCLPFFDEPDER